MLKSHYILNDFERSRKKVGAVALKIFFNILPYFFFRIFCKSKESRYFGEIDVNGKRYSRDLIKNPIKFKDPKNLVFPEKFDSVKKNILILHFKRDCNGVSKRGCKVAWKFLVNVNILAFQLS